MRKLLLLLFVLLLAGCAAETAQPTSQPDTLELAPTWEYRPRNNEFSLQIPRGWRFQETRDTQNLVVQFSEPGQNAAIITNLISSTQQLQPVALAGLLEQHLERSYGANDGFQQGAASPQPDGSQRVIWGYDAETGQRILGNSFIEQHGPVVALLTVALPSEDYARLQPAIDTILDSFHVADPSGDLQAADAPTIALQPLDTYSLPDSSFAVDVPSGWQASAETQENGQRVRWSEPGGNGWLVVQILPLDSQRSQAEREQLLADTTTQAVGTQTGFSADPPATDEQGRSSQEWRYTATVGGAQVPIAGRSQIELRERTLVLVVLAAPAGQAGQLAETIELISQRLQL